MAENRPLVWIGTHHAACEASDAEEAEVCRSDVRPHWRSSRPRCAAAISVVVAIAIAVVIAVAVRSGSFGSQKQSIIDEDALLVRDAEGEGGAKDKGGAKGAPVVRIVAIGDSLTCGTPFGPDAAYPEILQGMLGDGFLVANYGMPGRTVMKKSFCSGWIPFDPLFLCHPKDNMGKCDYWSSSLYTATMNSRPDIVFSMFGTNDAKGCNWDQERFVRDYVDLIRRVKNLPTNPKVYLIAPPPLFPPYPGNITPSVINEDFRWIMPKVNDLSGADGVIDAWTWLGGGNWQMMHTENGGQCFVEGENCTVDGCHLSRSGYEAVAKLVSKAIFRNIITTTKEVSTTPKSGALEEKEQALLGPQRRQ